MSTITNAGGEKPVTALVHVPGKGKKSLGTAKYYAPSTKSGKPNANGDFYNVGATSYQFNKLTLPRIRIAGLPMDDEPLVGDGLKKIYEQQKADMEVSETPTKEIDDGVYEND